MAVLLAKGRRNVKEKQILAASDQLSLILGQCGAISF
jgi:hypothetical protein